MMHSAKPAELVLATALGQEIVLNLLQINIITFM